MNNTENEQGFSPEDNETPLILQHISQKYQDKDALDDNLEDVDNQ